MGYKFNPTNGLLDISGAAGGGGTVTSVAAGNGMNFTTITASGSVTLGTPSTLTAVTTNSASGTTHTHAITGFLTTGVALLLDQTSPQTMSGGAFAGSGLIKLTSGVLGVDTNTYLTAVTAHNILSTTHGDSAAGSVVRGDIVYGNATPKWDRLAFPATPTGKILQASATDVVWSTNPLTIGASASVSGSNTGDQTITLSSDVTGSGTGSITTTIANNAVTYAKFVQPTAYSLVGNPTAAPANASNITLGASLAFATTTLGINLSNANLWAANQTFGQSNLLINNPAATFAYTIQSAAITAARTLTLPLITGSDTLVSLGLNQTFTGSLTMRVGTATAGTAPLYFQSGTNLTAAVAGAMEYDGTQLYFSNGATRLAVVRTSTGVLTSGRVPFASTSGFLLDSANMTFSTTAGLLVTGGSSTGNIFTSGLASTPALITRSIAGQSGDIQDWQDSSANNLARVDYLGSVYASGSGQSSLTKGLIVSSGTGNASTDLLNLNMTGTLVNGSTSGTADFRQTDGGTAYKRVVIYCAALTGTASYTFTTAFVNTPMITSAALSAVPTTLTNTAVTLTGAASTGFIILEGF